MTFRDYLTVLKRHLVLLFVAAALGLLAGGGYAASQTPVYESTSRVLVAVRSTNQITDLSAGAALASTVVKTYGDVSTAPYVLNKVIRTLGLRTDAATLAQQVTAEVEANSLVLDIAVRDDDAARAARIGNAITSQLTASTEAITPTADGSEPIKLTVIQGARAGSTPISPNLPLDLAIGLLVGLALAAGIVILREALDTRVKSVQALRELTDLPVLGEVRRTTGRTAAGPLAMPDSVDARSESYRTLRANLDFIDFDDAARTVLVTSSIAGEGKSTTAANLALALASAGESVLVVDADLRRPTLAGMFGLEGGSGLTDVLSGRTALDDAIQVWGDGGPSVLPSGVVPPNPSELLRGRSMAELIKEVGRRYTWVVFDSAPLVPVSDAALLAHRVSAVLLVSSLGALHRPQLAIAMEKLAQVGANVVGVVANAVPGRGKDRYEAYESLLPTQPRAAATAEVEAHRAETSIAEAQASEEPPVEAAPREAPGAQPPAVEEQARPRAARLEVEVEVAPIVIDTRHDIAPIVIDTRREVEPRMQEVRPAEDVAPAPRTDERQLVHSDPLSPVAEPELQVVDEAERTIGEHAATDGPEPTEASDVVALPAVDRRAERIATRAAKRQPLPVRLQMPDSARRSTPRW